MLGNLLPRAVNLTQIPSCGISCLSAGLNYTTCAPTNQTCLCFDTAYASFLDHCIRTNCTVIQGLTTQRAFHLGCGIAPKDNAHAYMVGMILPFALNCVFMILRLANRASHLAPWGWDDTTIVLAWLFTAAFLVSGILLRELGIGREYWSLTTSQINTSVLIYYIDVYIYIVALGLVKASICFLFLRIFESRSFQRVVWATQIFNLLLVLVFAAGNIAQCRPIKYFWHMWDGEHTGTCFNINAASYVQAGLNIALDLWMLVLPATQIWKLNMSIRWKWEASAAFAMGGFLTAISIVRLTTLSEFFTDPTSPRGYINTAQWTIAELNVGVIVACIPAARIFVVRNAASLVHSVKRPRRRSLTSVRGGDAGVLLPSRKAAAAAKAKAKKAAAANGHDSKQSSITTAGTATQTTQESQRMRESGVESWMKEEEEEEEEDWPPLREVQQWWVGDTPRYQPQQQQQQQGEEASIRELELGQKQTIEEG